MYPECTAMYPAGRLRVHRWRQTALSEHWEILVEIGRAACRGFPQVHLRKPGNVPMELARHSVTLRRMPDVRQQTAKYLVPRLSPHRRLSTGGDGPKLTAPRSSL